MIGMEVEEILREREEAFARQRTVAVWSLRFQELTREYERTINNARQALEIAADAILELHEAAQAPAEIAQKYNRVSRSLPFNLDLLLEDFVFELHRRGLQVQALKTH